VQNDYLLTTVAKEKWQKIGTQRRSGVLVPLFSVYSKSSLGIGDTHDLKLLVDWCNKTGNSILQLLPLNEVGISFCPYDSLSSFALEPSYIHLDSLINSHKSLIRDEAEEVKQLFPVGRMHMDYRIKQEKLHLLRDLFGQGEDCQTPEFNKFRQENAYWIEDFALFKVIKDCHDGLPWFEWQPNFKNRNPQTLDAVRKEFKDEIDFQIWIQWSIFKQLKDVKAYAEENNVFIKGDLPILVSRDSADVWQHQEFFKLEFAAGAPPDMYCAKGQRWGAPTYNWGNISSDEYRYIKEKLQYAENFYSIIRVDHVVGLFRIWSIPYNEPRENQGLNGFFDPRDESWWGEHGRNILNVMINSTNMLLCAEDLGTIPKVCTDSLNFLGIPGNEVQRWTKDWKVGHDFLPPEEYRPLSVTMLSTHDTTNWMAWWKYEAGTVDEGLFVRKCNERGIDYTIVRDLLFDLDLSYHGRLRWKNNISNVEILLSYLGRERHEVGDFVDMYLNTYREKERFWHHLGMKGPLQEEASPELVKKALKWTLDSRAIFCIQLLTDWLSLADIFEGDPYQYRINTPGIISDKNWSLVYPISLDELLRHRVNGVIKKMQADSKRFA